MSDKKFNAFLDEIQDEIDENEIKDYNKYIVNLCHNPKNWGKPSDDVVSISHLLKGPCGDTMQFFLKIEENIIKRAHFITDGCGASIATGSQTTLLIQNHTLDFVKKLKAEDIDTALKGLPADHKHCALLAINTVKEAIKKYQKR